MVLKTNGAPSRVWDGVGVVPALKNSTREKNRSARGSEECERATHRALTADKDAVALAGLLGAPVRWRESNELPEGRARPRRWRGVPKGYSHRTATARMGQLFTR
jgi:hypothetical protein